MRNPVYTEVNLNSEINAIHQEFEKNKVNDYWRLSQVEKLVASLNNDYYKFSTGNKESLENNSFTKMELFERLKEFQERWYSSNLMALTVIGKGMNYEFL